MNEPRERCPVCDGPCRGYHCCMMCDGDCYGYHVASECNGGCLPKNAPNEPNYYLIQKERQDRLDHPNTSKRILRLMKRMGLVVVFKDIPSLIHFQASTKTVTVPSDARTHQLLHELGHYMVAGRYNGQNKDQYGLGDDEPEREKWEVRAILMQEKLERYFDQQKVAA